jgi:cytoskeletal protein RodZ
MTQLASRPDPSSDTNELGAILREARESLKRELSDVSDELRIKLSYLQAIEDGRLDDLPGPAYAVGFLRGYATYLGLDAEDIVNRFKAAGAVKGDRTELHLPSPVADGRLPSAAVLIVAAVLAVCAYGTWYYVTSADKSREEKVAAVPQKIAESVNTVPVRPLPERGVLDAPPEFGAPTGEPAPASGEPTEPVSPTGAQRAAVDPKPAAPGTSPATRAAPEAPRAVVPAPGAASPPTAPKPTVEVKPLPPTSSRVAPPAADTTPSANSAVALPPQATEPAVAPPSPAAPTRSRSESRRDAARSDATPPRGGRASPPAEPAASSATPTDAPASVVVQDGSLPWLAPTDGAGASSTDATRTEASAPSPDRKVADARPQAARVRAAALPRPAEGEPTAAAASPAAPAQPAIDESDASGSITTLQPSDPQVALGAEGAASRGGGRAAEIGRRISIHAKVDTWVEVRRGGGAPVFSKLMKAGEAFEVPAQPGFKLSTGNAAGIDLMVDGQLLSPLGKSGAVKKNVTLDAEALLRSPGVAP